MENSLQFKQKINKYEMMKENLKNKSKESYEIIRFNSVESNT